MQGKRPDPSGFSRVGIVAADVTGNAFALVLTPRLTLITLRFHAFRVFTFPTLNTEFIGFAFQILVKIC
jgi:hypothetical protein